jgi:hypothetical protein
LQASSAGLAGEKSITLLAVVLYKIAQILKPLGKQK